MTDINNIGTKGEKLALEYLENKGYQILESNWRSKHYEIDIIALKSNFVVFVEVKTRSGNPVLKPEDAVNKTKQRMLISAANSYIFSKNMQQEARFDIVAIIFKNNQFFIHHIEDAFSPLVR